MKKTFLLEYDIYAPHLIDRAIFDFQDYANILRENNSVVIQGDNIQEIQNTFIEFMNYVLSLANIHTSHKSLSFEEVASYNSEKIANFRFKRFDDMYLITNDIWKYYFLSGDSFSLFIQGKYKFIDWYQDLIEKGFIKTSHYEDELTHKFRWRTTFIGTGPALHMIVVTLRCNHHCKYCHAAVAPEDASWYDMDQETAKKAVDAIMYTNSSNITIEFQWGEALLNWEIVQYIIEYASEQGMYLNKNITYTLVTNLTLMTEEKLEWLLDRWVNICTSLDGDKVIHNSNRTWYDWDSFDKVSYWIKRVNDEMQSRGMWNIWALLTTTKETLSRSKEIVDAYVDLWLNGIFLRWLNPYGFAASDIKSLWYSSEQWLKFYSETLDYIIELNKKGTDFREYITSVYLMKIFMDFDPAYMDIRSPSGIAVWWVSYNYDGKVYASDESRMLGRMWIDDFFMTDLKDSWQETYLAMMNSDITKIAVQASTLDGLPWYNDHVYKPYLWVDILHNFKQTGNIYVPLVKDEKTKIQIGILDIIFKKLQDPEESMILQWWLEKQY